MFLNHAYASSVRTFATIKLHFVWGYKKKRVSADGKLNKNIEYIHQIAVFRSSYFNCFIYFERKNNVLFDRSNPYNLLVGFF